jgi:cell wall assembly regulator SMI1
MAKKSTPQDEAHGAIIRGEVDTMRRLLAAGLPVNEPISDSRTPMAMAIRYRQPAIVRLLIEAGADVNAGDTPPLMQAASERQLASVQALLAAGADVHRLDENGMSALAHATGAKTGAALQVVRALIAAGAKGDAEALIWAAREGSPDIIRAVVAAGADVNEVSRWGTALILAVDDKRLDNVEALLLLGASVNLRVPEGQHYGGKTALDVAKENKLKKILPVLEAAAAGNLPVPESPAATNTPDIPGLWKRLKKAIPKEVKETLRKGATEAKIAELEAKLGVTLPADFRASYLLVNGQKDEGEGLIPAEDPSDEGYDLVPLPAILGEWQSWVSLLDINEFQGRTSSPDPGVRDDWWHRGWIPFASNGGGDSLCIDLAPAEGGTVGQVISMSHETGDRPILAKSFAEFLALLVQRWEDAEEEEEDEDEES